MRASLSFVCVIFLIFLLGALVEGQQEQTETIVTTTFVTTITPTMTLTTSPTSAKPTASTQTHTQTITASNPVTVTSTAGQPTKTSGASVMKSDANKAALGAAVAAAMFVIMA